ncbi:MAG: glutathione-disulfide reductase [Caulobacteraceae bacterium]
MAYDYDLFVIGGGSGGVRAARMAAMTGARVAVAEEYRMGGTCVVRGCVPKKLMVYASDFAHQFKTAKGYGWTVNEPTFDWPTFLGAKDREIARLSGIYTTNLQKAGADLFFAKARFVDAHTIELVGQEKTVTAEKILIATGGRPVMPAIRGIEHAINSDQAFHLETLPKSIVVVGGGYIAIEFACIFHGLGVDTTLIYRGHNLLRGFDEDVRAHLAEEMTNRGLKVALSCQHQSIEKTASGMLISHATDGVKIESEQVMFATGREPYVAALGLENTGVALNAKGAIAVDDYSKTNVDNIWAVGDVTDRVNLTPVAIREGAAFAETEFYGKPMTFDHTDIPTAVFSQPPVGVVGLSESEARHKFKHVDIYRTRFKAMRTAFAGDAERTLMKLVVDPASGRVLGCHIVGPEAGEMIQLAAIAVKAGLTKAQWDDTCALHPSAAEELVTLREKYVPNELIAAE